MQPTKTTALFLVLVSCYMLKMRNVAAKDAFTYEEWENFQGQDFCARKDEEGLFNGMCALLGDVDDTIGVHDDMTNGDACENLRAKFRSTKEGTKYEKIPLLVCTYYHKQNIEDHQETTDEEDRKEPLIPIAIRAFGKGDDVNGVAVYEPIQDGKEVVWVPHKKIEHFFLNQSQNQIQH